MSPSTLNDRKNALEHEFFSRQDQEAIDKLRSKAIFHDDGMFSPSRVRVYVKQSFLPF